MSARLKTPEDCPHVEDHTACPSGYLAWHAWAAKMSRTHKSTQCKNCGFWTIWEPKARKARP